jgi:hypothetical protein
MIGDFDLCDHTLKYSFAGWKTNLLLLSDLDRATHSLNLQCKISGIAFGLVAAAERLQQYQFGEI